jgi:ABC-type transport system involved in multi-copper enzyme maturation permease subunit
MRYLSLLRDSIKESLDRRSFTITLIGSSILILACASVGFEPMPREVMLKDVFERYGFPFLRISEVRSDGKDFDEGWSFRFEAGPLDNFHKRVLLFNAASAAAKEKRTFSWSKDPIPGLSPDRKTVLVPPSESEMTDYIVSLMHFVRPLRTQVVFEGQQVDKVDLRVSFTPKSEDIFFRGHRVNVLFGAWTLDRHYIDRRETVFFIQTLLAGYIVGWIGIMIGIVVTAGFFPNMLHKGMIDLILSRPVKRWSVFLLKYLGGLSYVAAAASFLIGGSWLALALRSGIWSPGFLLAIPLLIFFFAALYAVSAYIGLTKRNPTEAILVSVLAWFGLLSLGAIHGSMARPGSGVDPKGFWMRTVVAVHAVTPPLLEVDKAMSLCMLKANGITRERYAMNPRNRSPYPEVAWGPLFGLTGAWMAGLLGLGCWVFSRRDY